MMQHWINANNSKFKILTLEQRNSFTKFWVRSPSDFSLLLPEKLTFRFSFRISVARFQLSFVNDYSLIFKKMIKEVKKKKKKNPFSFVSKTLYEWVLCLLMWRNCSSEVIFRHECYKVCKLIAVNYKNSKAKKKEEQEQN